MAYNDDYNAGGDDDAAANKWYNQKDERTCRIYDHNDFFTVFVQILLAAFALGSLYIKRQQEVPKRTFKTWSLDVSKQGVGACYAHVCNMAIAAILSQQIEGETSLEDQCAWYGISYLIDTTLGLVLAIWCLRIQDWLAIKYNWKSILHTGVYSGPDGCKHWTYQTFAWVVILTIVKILIYEFMVVFSDLLAIFGSVMFAPLQINIRFELLFVMIFFPGFLNVIYFWIADSYLKAKDDEEGCFEETEKSDREIALISQEDKKLQEEADAAIVLTEEQTQAQPATADEEDTTSLSRHTEFLSTYLPSWSVFGGQPSPAVVPGEQQQQQHQQQQQ